MERLAMCKELCYTTKYRILYIGECICKTKLYFHVMD